MNNLHIINYNDFTPAELCNYLEERHYVQILSDLGSTKNYIETLTIEEDTPLIELINTLFHKLDLEINQLFTKDHILLFPYLIQNKDTVINLAPINLIHQRIIDILQKLRGLMNNYVQQPGWSNHFKICSNELHSLEQNIHHVIYVKEVFLWSKVKTSAIES